MVLHSTRRDFLKQAFLSAATSRAVIRCVCEADPKCVIPETDFGKDLAIDDGGSGWGTGGGAFRGDPARRR